MRFNKLEIDSVRNLRNVEMLASPSINVITGVNGSGKSSLIESIHFLSRGRSFRTRKVSQVMRNGSDSMFVAADVHLERRVDNPVRVGMMRSSDKTTFRLAESEVKASSELVREIPTMLIAPSGHELVEGSPAFRRRWTDMNVFHVKQDHLGNCLEYSRSLRHRNSLLRAERVDARQMDVWEQEMVAKAGVITAAREEYLKTLESETTLLLAEFGLDGGFSAALDRGWKNGVDFAESLVKCRDRDRRMRYTCDGPHAADIKFMIDGKDASSYLSRGYQKALFTALSIAAARIMSRGQEPPVILVDDLVADLDSCNVRKAVAMLSETGCQIWITATDISDMLPDSGLVDHKLFHVKLGTVSQSQEG